MQKDVKFLESKNVCLGAKIVKGAYLEYEKLHMKEHQHTGMYPLYKGGVKGGG